MKKEVEATYGYADEQGEPVFRVVRTRPKGFYQQRYENGKWVNGISGVRLVLYCLPEALAASTVFVAEPESI